jgi:hypothetical protein
MIVNLNQLIFYLRKIRTLIVITLSLPLYLIYLPIITLIYLISNLVVVRFETVQSGSYC